MWLAYDRDGAVTTVTEHRPEGQAARSGSYRPGDEFRYRITVLDVDGGDEPTVTASTAVRHRLSTAEIVDRLAGRLAAAEAERHKDRDRLADLEERLDREGQADVDGDAGTLRDATSEEP